MGFLVAQQNKIQVLKVTFLPIVTFLSYIIVVLLFICIVLFKNFPSTTQIEIEIPIQMHNTTCLNICLQDDSINNKRKC